MKGLSCPVRVSKPAGGGTAWTAGWSILGELAKEEGLELDFYKINAIGVSVWGQTIIEDPHP